MGKRSDEFGFEEYLRNPAIAGALEGLQGAAQRLADLRSRPGISPAHKAFIDTLFASLGAGEVAEGASEAAAQAAHELEAYMADPNVAEALHGVQAAAAELSAMQSDPSMDPVLRGIAAAMVNGLVGPKPASGE